MSLTGRKYNYSRQREVIYRLLASTTTHPTAEWLYQHARTELPNLSLGTVYRNLQILREQGRIRELQFGAAQSRFDAMMEPHHHFICEACGGMADVFGAPLVPIETVPELAGTEIATMHIEFHGRCRECVGAEAE